MEEENALKDAEGVDVTPFDCFGSFVYDYRPTVE
jgi:hypothetical protein